MNSALRSATLLVCFLFGFPRLVSADDWPAQQCADVINAINHQKGIGESGCHDVSHDCTSDKHLNDGVYQGCLKEPHMNGGLCNERKDKVKNECKVAEHVCEQGHRDAADNAVKLYCMSCESHDQKKNGGRCGTTDGCPSGQTVQFKSNDPSCLANMNALSCYYCASGPSISWTYHYDTKVSVTSPKN